MRSHGKHRHTPPLAILLVVCLAACVSGGPDDDTGAAGSPPRPAERKERPPQHGQPIELPSSPEFDELARLEYRRSTGNGRLFELLEDEDPRVRLRATRVCGRLPYPEVGTPVTDALSRRMEDPVPEVRHAAAFALGLRGDPNGSGVLASYRNDPDPELRARVVEAASRIPDEALHSELLVALRDADPRVRIEAAIGTARWDPEAANADEIDRALLDALRPYRIRPSRREQAGPRIEPEFVWRVLYALSRRRAQLGRGAFLEYAGAPGALERLFAVRGLARIEPDPEIAAALASVLADREADWRVAYEAAVGLGRIGDPDTLAALLGAVEHTSVHVRAAAMGALGSMRERRDEVLPKLRRGQLDVSAEVRAAAATALARLLPPEEALAVLDELARGEDAVLRACAATALGERDDPACLPILRRLVVDPEPRVAVTAVEALAGHPGPETRALLHELLGAGDNGLRLAAVLALREMADASDREPLEQAFRTSRGDVSAEIAFNVVENLGLIADDPSRAFVESAASDPRVHVARVARRVLAERFGGTLEPPAGDMFGVDGQVPLPGEDYPRYRWNPIVEVVTTRGSLVFELFPAEAPVHVYNFLQLALNGHYDDLPFHRVVPDFVVQGGDYRGDGNGSAPFNGASLPGEFTARKTIRGSLGMPRNEDPDSGGSQLFVTHRPTPHLDGRYTIFGELRQGGEVLDRIEVGDRILGIRLMRS